MLTCHNRCTLTSNCLCSVQHALSNYNNHYTNHIKIHYYITDDGCTDNTISEANKILGEKNLTVIHANGNAFWAGGMRMAWKCAINSNTYDFFLLLNDDTEVWLNLFSQLMGCHRFAVSNFNKGGLYSGNTTWFDDATRISFGGKILKKGFISRYKRLYPSGTPQKCDIVNANILLVSANVVEDIGIFSDYYVHSSADNDYGVRANKANYPVLITASFCGFCDAENYNISLEKNKLMKMRISERVHYLHYPTHSIRDSLIFSIKWRKTFVPIIIIMYFIQIICPSLYYKLLTL